MSLRFHVFATYGSQLFATLLGIAVVPLYLKGLGLDAYGLIGFFSLLQTAFALIDVGLTPTISRETARFYAGATAANVFRHLYRLVSLLFLVIALAAGTALFLAAPLIASAWLNVSQLPFAEVVNAVQIMAISVALRWLCGLYRGVLTGAEKILSLSAINALIAFVRFVGVFGSMEIWGYSISVFFAHQLAVAVLELVVLWSRSSVLVPGREVEQGALDWSLAPALPVIRFSIYIAATSSIWVLVTQADKLVLSGILSLADYGVYTLAVTVAGVIIIITSPIATVLLPRFARLHAEGRGTQLIKLYNQFTAMVSVVACSTAATLVVYADPLVRSWTGNEEIAASAAPIVKIYALGNALLAIAAFPYYLQYARGNLRYHVIGSVGMAVLLLPAVTLSAHHAGGLGAALAWLLVNAANLFFWVGYVHRRLEPGLHVRWLRDGVLKVALIVALLAVPAGMHLPAEEAGVVKSIFSAGAFWLTSASLAALSIRWVRKRARRALRALFVAWK
jgi:O-antigen/teichoic acid export membrane protein